MAMNPNMGMANMSPMGGSVGGAPMPSMNNGAVSAQLAAAAIRQPTPENLRGILNTYIYEYFIRFGMYDCARSLLSSDQPVNVSKDGTKGAANGDDMDADTKDDLDSKLPDDLPPANVPHSSASETSFLHEWFCLFWDMLNASRGGKTTNGIVNQYVTHTQQQSRLKQNQQQELLRQMRPDLASQQFNQMRMMQNGNMNMNMKNSSLQRAAIANNQNNPPLMMQQAKQNQMQRDPSGMDPNRDRPASPAPGDNMPSPAKRARIDGAPLNSNQPGPMGTNGRPASGMHGQQMSINAHAAQTLAAAGVNPSSLNAQQLANFANASHGAQQKSIATYSQNLQQHHGSQMGTKPGPNAGGAPHQGSPMMPPGTDGTAVNAYYNPEPQLVGPGGMRPGQGGTQQASGSNHALQDYQMQLMLLEQQNKKRLMMARQEQDINTGMPREGGAPGAPGQPGSNPQSFTEASPQAIRSGASPNSSDQMKRGTPQMNNAGISSPVPESRESPNHAMHLMAQPPNDPSLNPHFFTKPGAENNMNGMRPPSSHPVAQPFNGQIMARQMQQSQSQGGQQPGGQGQLAQWQQGPNGQIPQGMQPNQQVQGTQQRSMPPPSAPPAASNNASGRTTASPQAVSAAPPTPSQSTKAAPKKKESKAAKEKRVAAAKKANQNAGNSGTTPAGENAGDPDATPATPITPVTQAFGKNSQAAAAGINAQTATSAAATAATIASQAPQPAPVPPQAHGDPNQNGLMDSNFGMMEFSGMELANPLQSNDVLNDFDFDSFLHDGDGATEPFDFGGPFSGMEGGEIGAE